MTKRQDVIRRYTSIAATIDTLRHRQLTLLDPATWDDRNDRYFMDLYKEGRQSGGLYAACAATCFETYHHWRVFTTAADGACIELFREPLEKALRPLSRVRFGEVEYLTLDDADELSADHLDDLPFMKRVAFAPEQEYRIIAETEEPQEIALGLELSLSWIGRILLNPWLPSRVADSIKATLTEINGCQNLTVVRSHLIESSRWKRAGDRVTGNRSRSRIQFRRNRRVR